MNLLTKEYMFPYISILEAVVRRCSAKKVFLNIIQNSQENTVVTKTRNQK